MTVFTATTKHTTAHTAASDPAIMSTAGQMIGFFCVLTYPAVVRTSFTAGTKDSTNFTASTKN